MKLKRTILTAVFQLLAVAAIILSLKPCLDLFFYANRPGGLAGYDHLYWNYWMIRSWLIALAGISVGLVFFWVSSRFKSKNAVAQNAAGVPRCSIKRIAAIICLVVGIILTFAFLPGLSSFFGKNALHYPEPMEFYPIPRPTPVFMVMSNELATPPIEIRLPDKYTN